MGLRIYIYMYIYLFIKIENVLFVERLFGFIILKRNDLVMISLPFLFI